MKIKTKNGMLAKLYAAFGAICAANAPGWVGVRAHRNRKAVADSLAPVEATEGRIMLAHGAKSSMTPTGPALVIAPGPDAVAANAELTPLWDDDVELELQEIPLEELQQLRMERAGDHIGLLMDLGIASVPAEEGAGIPSAVAERVAPGRNGKAKGGRPARAT